MESFGWDLSTLIDFEKESSENNKLKSSEDDSNSLALETNDFSCNYNQIGVTHV